jgi:hypothetical protein
MTPKWIKFDKIPWEVGVDRVTDRWQVLTIDGRELLGMVEWYSRWRCYCFAPDPGTIFERWCLRDIADFCEEQTKARKKAQVAV